MKKVLLLALPCLMATTGYQAMAQNKEEDKEKKEVQEIIIRKKGDKETKLSLEFKGDKVLINGKPLVEFKDDEIIINNKKMMVINGDKMKFFGEDGKAFEMDFERFGRDIEKAFSFTTNDGAFLGVSTGEAAGGAKIEEVTKGSAAEKAGLKEGDIITAVGDKKIASPAQLSEAITAKKPKDEVKIEYLRNGKKGSTSATLGERKVSGTRSFSMTSPDGKLRSFTVPEVIVEGKPMAPRLFENDMQVWNNERMITAFGRPKLGLKIQDTEEGDAVKVLDVEADTPAAKAGLQKDDLITAIGGVAVKNTDEARDQLNSNAQKSTYTIEAKRDGKSRSFEIKIPKKLKTANL